MTSQITGGAMVYFNPRSPWGERRGPAPLHCAQIFPPLLLNMNECPLPSAKGKMLQAGQLEEVLLPIDHPMR